MTTKTIEDTIISTLPPEMQDAARDRLDELLEEGERLREKSEDLLEEAEDAMAAWKAGNPVVGTIEWHLKKADDRLQDAWGQAVGDVINEWRKNEGDIGQVSHKQLLAVIEILGGSLLPRLNSIAAVNAPAEPEVKPTVDADRVIRALQKDPALLQAVRERLGSYEWDAIQGTYERVTMQMNTTKKLTLNLPDDAPSGEYTLVLSVGNFWPGHAKYKVKFHAVGGEIEGERFVYMGPPFPVQTAAHMDGGPLRKVVAHVQTETDGYIGQVRLEAIPHAR